MARAQGPPAGWFHELGRLDGALKSSVRRDILGPSQDCRSQTQEVFPTEPRPRPRHPASDILRTASRDPYDLCLGGLGGSWDGAA